MGQNNKVLMAGLVVVLVVGGIAFMNAMKQATPEVMPIDNAITEPVQPTPTIPSDKETMEEGTQKMKGEVKEFTIAGTEFAFDIKEITVKKGDTVKITLTNPGEMPHDWKLDEFEAATKIIKTGETDTIEFVANEVGTYEYYCSVGQHRANGMFGTLIVEE